MDMDGIDDIFPGWQALDADHRRLEKINCIADSVRNFCLVNYWCPWMIIPSYLIYEQLLRKR